MDECSDEIIDECFEFACDIAKKAGVLIRNAYYAEKGVSEKSCVTDLVTETDQEVEKNLLEAIKSKYPSHKFIGEESVAGGQKCELTDFPTWIIDPIDGTTNFVHTFPYIGVCIGFVWRKERKFGVVYSPIFDELYTGKKGRGAFLNGVKLSTSTVKELNKSLILTEFGSSRDKKIIESIFKNMRAVIQAPVHSIHSLGSAAMNICMVARGSAEAYYEFGIHCWDYCAASIILEEAGGVTVDTEGGTLDLMRRRIIAANCTEIAQSLSKTVVEHLELPRD